MQTNYDLLNEILKTFKQADLIPDVKTNHIDLATNIETVNQVVAEIEKLID